MTLNELQKGESAIIKQLDCDKVLKSRLNSFGLKKGEKINIEEVTLAKETIKININRTKIALRVTEASNIKVEKC